MIEEFEPIDKLSDVCALLDEMFVKYEVHRHDNGDFSFLKDREASIEVSNPYTDRTMFIDLQDEFSLFFGKEWHDHYSPCNYYFDELIETLAGLLRNELCSAAVFIGENRKWAGSRLSSKAEVSQKSAEEIFSEPCPQPGEAEEIRNSWKEKGAEVHFLFWDPKDDKIVTIERKRL